MSVEGSDPQSRDRKKCQKVSDSHRNDVSPLTQGLCYRAACDRGRRYKNNDIFLKLCACRPALLLRCAAQCPYQLAGCNSLLDGWLHARPLQWCGTMAGMSQSDWPLRV